MEFEIWVSRKIKIDDSDVLRLCKSVKKRFSLPASEKVFPEDLITQAMLDGLVDNIEETWYVDKSEADDKIDPRDYKK